MPSGYSGTPLRKKLGLKADARAVLVDAPDDFAKTLGPIAIDMGEPMAVDEGPLDFALLFVRERSAMEQSFPRFRERLQPDGMIWVAWPKKTSGLAGDLTDSVVREVGLAYGLVDTKVCAVDDIWSGLKFVFRLVDRPAAAKGKGR